ncbi:hypothetical protein A2U01_0089088, partial [Trifolium medium]|nr:hypothetical protein [Trifolium medium]
YDVVPKPGSPIRPLMEGPNREILQTFHRLSTTPEDGGILGGHLPRGK